ncbi:hypothetical protein GGX14DRAFT_394532 [Mycena pura]|uniref:Uncharacterized protein n=1 Tax=Mycena pura TaxID=153505 RepID=A0AAD6VJ22_9AGAR|nr:hypothetical protein GGX14DRAFT_394532 [Mycena pura]
MSITSADPVSINPSDVQTDHSESPDPQSTEAEVFSAPPSDDGSEIYMPDFSDDEYYNPPPRYDPEIAHTLPNVMRRMLMLVTDDVLKSNFTMLLCGPEQDGNYARPYCYYSQLRNGNYALRPYVNTLFTNRLETCAGLIFTALNDHSVDNRGFIIGFHPVTVPAEALRQCNIRVIPSILLFLSRDWTLFPKEFATEFGVKKGVAPAVALTADLFIM